MGTMATSNTAKVTLPTDTQILITREFDAPRHLVYRAYTTPELIKRWWSGERGEVTSAEVDLRPGGTWRYVMIAHGSFEVAFHGEYHEITPPSRLVFTEIFEPYPDSVSLVTAEFGDEDGKTRFTVTVGYPSLQVRDMVLASGMDKGAGISYDRLEDLLAELQRS